jgi:hypothetical protein
MWIVGFVCPGETLVFRAINLTLEDRQRSVFWNLLNFIETHKLKPKTVLARSFIQKLEFGGQHQVKCYVSSCVNLRNEEKWKFENTNITFFTTPTQEVTGAEIGKWYRMSEKAKTKEEKEFFEDVPSATTTISALPSNPKQDKCQQSNSSLSMITKTDASYKSHLRLAKETKRQIDLIFEQEPEISYMPSDPIFKKVTISDLNQVSGPPYKVDDSFILHGLLDGFLADDLGNQSHDATRKFIAFLSDYKNEWAEALERALIKGLDLCPKREYDRDAPKSIPEWIELHHDEFPPPTEDTLVIGGYESGTGGHATSFRFMPQTLTIRYVNSGDGLQFHQKLDEKTMQSGRAEGPRYMPQGMKDLNEKYEICVQWRCKDVMEWQAIGRRLMAALKCPLIDNVNDAYKYEFDIFQDVQMEPLNLHVVKEDVNIADKMDARLCMYRSNWQIKNGRFYSIPQISGTCSYHAIFWQLLLASWEATDNNATADFELSWRERLLNSVKLTPENEIFALYEQAILKPISFVESEDVQDMIPIRFLLQELQISRITYPTLLALNKLWKVMTQWLWQVEEAQGTGSEFEFPLLMVMLMFENRLQFIANGEVNQKVNDTMLDLALTLVRATKYLSLRYPRASIMVLNATALVAKLHEALPQDQQVPQHPEKDTDIRDFFTPCATVEFLAKFANYTYDPYLTYSNDQRVMQWTELVAKHNKAKQPNFRNKWFEIRGGNNPIRIIFKDFLNISSVYATIGLTVLLVTHKLKLQCTHEAYETIWTLNNFENRLIDSQEPNVTDQGLEFLTDLESGASLIQALTRKCTDVGVSSILPEPIPLVYGCEKTKLPFFEYGSYRVRPELFYNDQKAWIQNIWLTRAIPHIFDTIKRRPDLQNTLLTWLFYVDQPLASLHESENLTDVNAQLLKIWHDEKALENFDENSELHKWLQSTANRYLNFFQTYGSSSLCSEPEMCRDTHFIISLARKPKTADLFLEKLLPTQSEERRYVLPGFFHLPWGPWNRSQTTDIYKDENGLLSILDENTPQYSWQARIGLVAGKIHITHAWWTNAMKNSILNLHVRDKIIRITSKTCTLPTNVEYELIAPQDAPACMRQWLDWRPTALALLLKKEQQFFLLVIGSNRIETSSIFTHLNVFGFDIHPRYALCPMTASGFMPAVTRNIENWSVFLAHLISSQKSSCLAILHPVFRRLMAQDKTKLDDIAQKIKDLSWPLVSSKSEVFRDYLTLKYDELPGTTGSAQKRMWHHLRTYVGSQRVRYELLDKLMLSEVLLRNNYSRSDRLSMRPSTLYFQILTGKIIRSDQTKVIREMRTDLQRGLSRVRIALMGIGKTTVIIPVLVIAALLGNQGIRLVQPPHLVHQSEGIFDELSLALDKQDFEILSDADAKLKYLKGPPNVHNNMHIVLFDEIDHEYNCFRSDFNIPHDRISHPLGLPVEKLTSYYEFVVQLVFELHITKHDLDLELQSKLRSDLKNINQNMIFKLHYGLRPGNLLAVPFEAVNQPLPNALFSDIDMTAILTSLIREKQGLSIEDVTLLQDKVQWLHKQIGITNIGKWNVLELLKANLDDTRVREDRELQVIYLTQILLPLHLFSHQNQLNVSFIDLMSPHYAELRAGFSGTKLMHIPKFRRANWQSQILPSDEESICAAILGTDEKKLVIPFPGRHDLWSKLEDFDVLIDAGALLRKYSSMEVVNHWSKYSPPETVFLVIGNDHIPRVYDPRRPAEVPVLYQYSPNLAIRAYFDQQHTVGVDVKLPGNFRAMTLVRPNNKLSEIAQAVFRLRNIQGRQTRGQRQHTEFMMQHLTTPLTKKALFRNLKQNDEQFLKNMLPRHYEQNLKAILRSEQNYSLMSYQEPVPYALLPSSFLAARSPLGEKLAHLVKTNKRNNDDNAETQTQIEQVSEMEQEHEEVKHYQQSYSEFCMNMMPSSQSMRTVFSAPISKTRLNIEVWSREVDAQCQHMCFIRFRSGFCRVMPIVHLKLAETYAKQTNYTPDESFEIYFRYSLHPRNADGAFYLAMVLIGAQLAIHEQLHVIRLSTPSMQNMNSFFMCLDVKMTGLLAAFAESNVRAKSFLIEFASTTVEQFTRHWLRWNAPSSLIMTYWQTCMSLANNLARGLTTH